MRIVVVLAILSAVFGLDNEFLFIQYDPDANLLETSTESMQPNKFKWWSGFGDTYPLGKWVGEFYLPDRYHGCGFSILYDVDLKKYDNDGIEEIYLIGCKGGEPTPIYQSLTDLKFRENSGYSHKYKDIICKDNSSLVQYSIRYQPYQDSTDNEGVTGIRILCTQGSYQEYDRDLEERTAYWTKPVGLNPAIEFVCGAKAKYQNLRYDDKDEIRVTGLDIAICGW